MNRHTQTLSQLDRNELDKEELSYRDEEAGNGDPSFAGVAPRQLEFSVIVGVLASFRGSHVPLVDFAENETGEAVAARSIVHLSSGDIGSEIALAFERGDSTKPIILGCLKSPSHVEREGNLEIKVDGEQIMVSAKKEIVIGCGKASITLTQAGKVLIRGGYLLSQSSGVNRIKGGSVQIN